MGNDTFFKTIFYGLVSRETMERCSALYAEVQRSVGRLARVCERRKAQLEKHLPSPPSPPAADSRQDCDDDVDDGHANTTNDPLSTCRQVSTFPSSSFDMAHSGFDFYRSRRIREKEMRRLASLKVSKVEK